MENDPTHGVDAASFILQARIDALPVEAALVHAAIIVSLTFDLLTLGHRVASKPTGTETDRSVVGNTAFGIGSTSVALTWTNTFALQTSFFYGAVIVGATSRYASATTTQLSLRTLIVQRALESAAALQTRFTTVARRGFRTRSYAEAAQTVGPIGTVRFLLATGRCFATSQLWVTDGTGRASALCRVIDHVALGTRATHIGSLTRISAVVVDTGLISGTGGVIAASGNTDAVIADMTSVTESVAVAHGATGTVDTTRIR